MARTKVRNLSTDTRFTDLVTELASGYQTIGQMVYSVLRAAILNGAFAPGEWLRQESLATAIGVSRIPVRSALLQLESEGMVTFHPRRGARVRTLSQAQINESYRIRLVLETYALRLTMGRMTPERVERLRVLASDLDNRAEGGEFLSTRVEFYRELYDSERNPMLVSMIEELRNTVGRYLLAVRIDGEHHRHAELVERIASGDVPAAEGWLYEHLEGVRRGIEKLAQDIEDDSPDPIPDTAQTAVPAVAGARGQSRVVRSRGATPAAGNDHTLRGIDADR